MFKSEFRIKLEENSIKNFYPHHFPAKATKITLHVRMRVGMTMQQVSTR
jgi:hypothetical protein